MIIVAYFSLSIWPTRIHSTKIDTLGCVLQNVWDRILLTLMMSEMYSLKVAELNYKLSEWDEKTHFWDPIYKRKWIFVPIDDLVVVSKPRMIVDPSTTSKSQLKTDFALYISTFIHIYVSWHDLTDWRCVFSINHRNVWIVEIFKKSSFWTPFGRLSKQFAYIWGPVLEIEWSGI